MRNMRRNDPTLQALQPIYRDGEAEARSRSMA